MASSWALVCSTAFVWVTLSSASMDELVTGQHEISFDDLKWQVGQKPDSSMLQKPMDVTELLKDALGQEILPRGRRPSFDPMSFGGPVEQYPVQFPLGRPTSDNLQAICLNGDRRPRYPKSYFPASGFSSQLRMGKAVNKAESWFSICCMRNQTMESNDTLCCATRAWGLSIKSFCKEEFRVKTRHYHCCHLHGIKRLNCFNNNALNPNYEPTEEIPMPPLQSTAKFNFDPSTCKKHAGKHMRGP